MTQQLEQAVMCLGCGLAGCVPAEAFPQEPGPAANACVVCDRRSVWVAPPTPVTVEQIHPADVVEMYLAAVMKRGNRRARGASQ